MGMFFIMSALQLGAVFIIGSPITLVLATRSKPVDFFGWWLLTPAFGVTLYLGFATLLHCYGLGGMFIFQVLIVIAFFTTLYIIARTFEHGVIQRLLWGIAFVVVGAAIVLIINAGDIVTIGLDAYFPLTNSDTFAYLGFIDQIRTTGWREPVIHYPAGYIPQIAHALSLRVPGVIYVADFADVLGLDTHAAFFLTQRTALPIIVLGSAGIVAIITGSVCCSSICFALLTLGNFLLHQVLQQFNSTTMGTIVTPVLLAMAIWTSRDDRTRCEFLTGSGVLGLIMGTMAATSPEAHPFYLLLLVAVLIFFGLARHYFRQMIIAVLIFSFFYVLISHPLVIGLWSGILGQFKSAASGHPGDWVAAPGFIVQISGIGGLVTGKFFAYSIITRLASVSFLFVFASALFAHGWNVAKVVKKKVTSIHARQSDLFVVLAFVGVMLFLQVYLYARGLGYGLLKLTDYFVILPSIVVSVGASFLCIQTHRYRRRIFIILIMIVICMYGVTTVQQKYKDLKSYSRLCKEMPAPSDYRLTSSGNETPGLVVADLPFFTLNLFLYVNRWGTNLISFGKNDTPRFLPLLEPDYTGWWLARIPRVGVAGLPLADITYVGGQRTNSLVEISPLIGQIHILPTWWLDPTKNGGWLDPEGQNPYELKRWLSRNGAFKVYGGPSLVGGSIEMQLDPGPDLSSENLIEIYFGDQLQLAISAHDLPKLVVLCLPVSTSFELVGEIRITGPALGIRQIFVSRMRTLNES